MRAGAEAWSTAIVPSPGVRRRPATLAVLAVLGLLAGCGSADDDAGSEGATPTEASSSSGSGDSAGEPGCANADTVSGVVGAEVALDPSSGGDLGCSYYSDDGVVSVNVTPEDPTTRTIEDVERNHAGVQRVDGVGDAAYGSVTPGGIIQFGVFEGTSHTLVTIQGVDGGVAVGQAVYELVASSVRRPVPEGGTPP